MSDIPLNKVRWACRRGMLELDVIFNPFVENHYSNLPEEEQVTFRKLLVCDDPELFAWFMGHEDCPKPEFAALIKKIHKLNGAKV
ncbi:succinate dehydrogenase assembly factor 2 family protein [Saccharobesus litoralis]|uniref:FAD assembly factor SdhE n=1 Tax=Saccharobesus litoralis TaxID=2172099 RepID=A0A2S0VS59_9ALTE|nr:succinate dehydrogenase assembly factor 2 [Saccharobesus litoralis]AWB67055.1 succinate dehydrogenase assembly factor 2 family protein [Saccharobesus litoralis]